MFEGLQTSLSALDEARQRGQDEVRPNVLALEQELARIRQSNIEWQREVSALKRQLAGLPGDLLAEVKRFLIGDPSLKEGVAGYWSRIPEIARLAYLPIVAAVAGDCVVQPSAESTAPSRLVIEYAFPPCPSPGTAAKSFSYPVATTR